MKIVIDTNVWLSGIFWDGEASKIIEKAEGKELQIIISQNILSEITLVLERESKFQKFMTDLKQRTEDIIRTILSFSVLVETKTNFGLIKEDPKDNIILEAAFDGKADYIISYDKHILNMKEFRSIKILPPKEFLKIIKGI